MRFHETTPPKTYDEVLDEATGPRPFVFNVPSDVPALDSEPCTQPCCVRPEDTELFL